MSKREDSVAKAIFGVLILVVIIGIIVGNSGVFKDADESSPPDAATKKVIDAVERYYAGKDIGGGWMVVGLHHRGGDIAGKLLMTSDEQQCGFLRDGAGDREQAISVACPADNDRIWAVLGSRDLILDVSCKGRVFYKHSCRQAHPSDSTGPASAND